MRSATLATCLLAATATAAEPPSLEQLGACADRAWEEDVAGWAEYSFDRHVVLRDLDRNGEEKSRKERHFRMTPTDGGFDERLLTEDGRAATADEIREFRQKANFTKNYRGAAQLEFANPLGENLVLRPVLRGQRYRLVGETEIDGIPCYHMVFDARPEPGRGSTEKQLQHATRGSVCIAVEGCHMVEMKLDTVRPIKQIPARIEYLEVVIRGRPAAASWVPKKVEAQFDFVVLGRHVRRFTTYTYSNFRLHEGRPRLRSR